MMRPMLRRTRVRLGLAALLIVAAAGAAIAHYRRGAAFIVEATDMSGVLQRLAALESQPVSRAPGEPGVLRQTTLDDYRRGLPNHTLVDMSPCIRPLGMLRDHHDSFWRAS